MAANSTPLLIEGYTAASAISRFSAVAADGSIPAAGGAAVGFAASDQLIGLRVPVVVGGTGIALAGAAITKGQTLQVGASGTVIPRTAGRAVGRAMISGNTGDQIEVLIQPEYSETALILIPSGGDDGPAILAAAVANNGRITLGPGHFKLSSYLNLDMSALGIECISIQGAGIRSTFIDVQDSLVTSHGTVGANWVDSKAAITVFTSSNVMGSSFEGFCLRRVVSATQVPVTVNAGLGIKFDQPATYYSTSYTPSELIGFDGVGMFGWDVCVACNDVTNMSVKRCQFLGNYGFSTGFNCDIFRFDQTKFGTALAAAGVASGNKPMTPIWVNSYIGRGNQALSYTVSNGVATVATGAPVLVAGAQIWVQTTGTVPAGIRTILSIGAGTFTFDVTGYNSGSGAITMGPHGASGAGNHWIFDSCWFMGNLRVASTVGQAYIEGPIGWKFLNCYWEQDWMTAEFGNECDVEFENCYGAGAPVALATAYLTAYETSRQRGGPFTAQMAGSDISSSRIKFKKCNWRTEMDGFMVYVGANIKEVRTPYFEIDDCKITTSVDATRALTFVPYLIGADPNSFSHSRNCGQIVNQYQSAINTDVGVVAAHFNRGQHRFVGMMRVKGGDAVVYQVSSNAAANIAVIPSTLVVQPLAADTYVVESLDKNIAISGAKTRRQDAPATFDDYVADFLVVEGTSRPNIESFGLMPLKFLITQDATGGRTVTWDASYKFAVAAPAASGTANQRLVIQFEWNGYNYYQTGPAAVWTA